MHARHGWPLAYALAWLSVAGGNSVMPPWVRHQFPDAGHLVRRLRDYRMCGSCLQLVPGTAQRPQGTYSLVRLHRIPSRADG